MHKILIIDDEPQIRRFLNIGLGAQGYQIIEAENGRQGFRPTRFRRYGRP
jgi:two-component system KDP operon response regulator KdpE